MDMISALFEWTKKKEEERNIRYRLKREQKETTTAKTYRNYNNVTN